MIGYSLIVISLLCAVTAAYYFYASQCSILTQESQNRFAVRAQYLFGTAAVFIACASFFLLYLLLSNRFEYFYVFRYTSVSLAVIYKISAFWAGQEGSFLLWAALHSLLGIGLMRQTKTPARVMMVHALIQALLLAILLVKTPFMLVGGAAPSDGMGLNPMLQDFWMIVHPPIIFVGYAGLAIPFAFAIEGALSGRISMIRSALPWTLLAWGMLGMGIFIGGFWAYKVLGWGGYWAWDPVENASLVPWLFSGAAIHLMLHALKRPSGSRLAYLAMVLSFIAVLFGTFIARSGIMADFSTHSFPDEGLGVILSFCLILCLVPALAVLIIKWPGFDSGPLWDTVFSRDFLLVLAAAVLITETGIVFFGMTLPLMTAALGQPQQVSNQYYNLSSLPIALVVILGVCRQLYKGCSVKQPSYWVHAGTAVMIVGIIVSSAGSQSMTASVQNGDTLTAFGQEIRYSGKSEASDKGYKNIFHIDQDTDAVPVFSQTKLNADGSPNVTEPAILRGLLSDIYIAPAAGDASIQEVAAALGETVSKDRLQIQFLGFKMDESIKDKQPGVRAQLSIILDGRTEQCAPALYRKAGGFASSVETVFDRYKIQLVAINAKDKTAVLGITDLHKASVVVDISLKPLVSFVWIGCLLISAGALWSGYCKLHRRHSN